MFTFGAFGARLPFAFTPLFSLDGTEGLSLSGRPMPARARSVCPFISTLDGEGGRIRWSSEEKWVTGFALGMTLE